MFLCPEYTFCHYWGNGVHLAWQMLGTQPQEPLKLDLSAGAGADAN